jgi:hypothetical protein
LHHHPPAENPPAIAYGYVSQELRDHHATVAAPQILTVHRRHAQGRTILHLLGGPPIFQLRNDGGGATLRHAQGGGEPDVFRPISVEASSLPAKARATLLNGRVGEWLAGPTLSLRSTKIAPARASFMHDAIPALRCPPVGRSVWIAGARLGRLLSEVRSMGRMLGVYPETDP